MLRHGDTERLIRPWKYEEESLCIAPGCDGAIIARGYCVKHYQRWKAHGDPLVTKLPRVSFSHPEELKAFMLSRRIVDADDCWLWTGNRGSRGYGWVFIDGGRYLVHRVSLALFGDFELSSPLLACHRCDVPACFNPDHLFPGTEGDNSRDMAIKGRAARGERSPHSKLSESAVRRIRKRLAAGESQQSIADRYGINQTLVSHIKCGRAWKHVA